MLFNSEYKKMVQILYSYVCFQKRNFEKFLLEVMDKKVLSSRNLLTTHCNNLPTHHYYLTYHPCFDTQFCHGQTTQRYFRAVAMSSRKKPKRSSWPFVPRRASGKKKKKELGLQIAASDKGSYYTQHESEEVVPGNCVAIILWLY